MLKALAYGKALVERRKAGQRVGLLVISLYDWEAGKWFECRPEVARLVLPQDAGVDAVDWSACLALDCVVCGAAVDGTFYEACSALKRAGAASVWGEFDDGIYLLETAGKRWCCTEGPFSVNLLGAALRRHREASMMLRLGFYGSRVFDTARMALLDNVPGLANMLKSGSAA